MTKRYDIEGVSSNVEFGKGGSRLFESSGKFRVRANDDTDFVNIEGADPVSDDDLATKRYVDALTVTAGTVTNSTLRWSGTAWVENTAVTATSAGDLRTALAGIGTAVPTSVYVGAFGNASPGDIAASPGGNTVRGIRVGSTSGVAAVHVGVSDGSRNSRAKFFLADGAGGTGAFGLATSWSSNGAQPFVIYSESTEWMRINTSGNPSFPQPNSILTIGNGAGNPRVIIDKTDAGDARLRFRNGGLDSWDLLHDGNENLQLLRFDAAGAFLDSTILVAKATGAVTLSSNLTLSSASPVVTIGNAAGTPILQLNADDVLQAIIRLQKEGIARWDITASGSAVLTFDRRDASGVFQDQTTVSPINHQWTYPGIAVYNSANPSVIIGAGTGSPILDLRKSDAGEALVAYRVGAVTRFDITLNTSEDAVFRARDSGGAVQFTTTYANATGNWTMPAGLTLSSASPTLTMGDATGAPTVVVAKSDAGISQVLDLRSGGTATTNRRWLLQFANNNNLALLRRDSSGGVAGTVLNISYGDGGTVALDGINGTPTGTGGAITISGGAGGSTSGNGGAVTVRGGLPTDGNGGSASLIGRAGIGTNRTGGTVAVTAGASSGNAAGGPCVIDGGIAGPTGAGGTVTITGGPGGATSGAGGAVTVRGGTATDGNGGALNLFGRDGVGTDRNGGIVSIAAGNATGTGLGGIVAISAGTSPSGPPGIVAVSGDAVFDANIGLSSDNYLTFGAIDASKGAIRYTDTATDVFDFILNGNIFFSMEANGTFTGTNLGKVGTPWDVLYLRDGVSTPSVGTASAVIFIDSADGDLKVRFADGTVKLIVTDT